MIGRPSRAQLRGVVAATRAGNLSARALAVADSRAVVRSLFLSSALRAGLLDQLRSPCSVAELARYAGCSRRERLEAWLDVGTELGELRRQGGYYKLCGRRARAIAGGDAVLAAHYRSMLDYQAGAYADLGALLQSDPGRGRDDLAAYADDIAQVSRAATPFLADYLTRLVGELRPERLLDVGCGTGIYSRIAAEAYDGLRVDGIDVAADAIDLAQAEVRRAGLDGRIQLYSGDVRDWPGDSFDGYDVILLLNNIYYFPPHQRAALYRQLGGRLRPGGQLVVVSMVAPGSVAAAHLHFMLACQSGAAGLPHPGELEAGLARAGYEVTERRTLVPTEPLVALRATRLPLGHD